MINTSKMLSAWDLSSQQRDAMIARASASIAQMALSRGVEIADDVAMQAAQSIEKKAYTAAQVSSNTTTNVWDPNAGHRPLSETTKSYTRKLADLLLETVVSGGAVAKTGAEVGGGQAIDLTGSRDFLTAETTEEFLALMLAPGAQVKKIKFSTKSFGRAAAQVAAKAIQACAQTLVDADISDVIAGRPEEEALDALRILCEALSSCRIARLNLSDNALGEKGVRACAAAFAGQPALESISLQNVGCSIHACAAVDELLRSTQRLKQVHLFNNMSGDEGAIHIASILARAPLMEDFKMASSRVGPEGGSAIARGLSTGCCLVRLDLSDNPMTEQVAISLAELVKKQPGLRCLNLNDTSLTDEGIKVVCGALTGGAPVLEELELALNEVTLIGAKAVAIALLNKPKLWRVNLRENELEDLGAVIISKALALMPSLRSLDATGNQLKRIGAVALSKSYASVAKSELGLCSLSLDENCVSEEGIEEIKQVLTSVGLGDSLGSLEENMEEDDEDLEEEEEDELTAALSSALEKAKICP